MSKPNGIVLYRGKSLIDGSNIVCVATGLRSRSKNKKTGDMIQFWILCADKNPMEANRCGDDKAVCGSCKHRHFRSCYVNMAHGPIHVYNALERGAYTEMSFVSPGLKDIFKGRQARFGAYGDPAAIPTLFWQVMASYFEGYTSYTHRWKQCDPSLKTYCMASCDTEEEAADAKRRGWRTFYVRQETDALPEGFFVCPASEEGGRKTSCENCGACKGGEASNKKNPCIIAHGNEWKMAYYRRGMKLLKAKKKIVGAFWKSPAISE
jgi:hypothetical protein